MSGAKAVSEKNITKDMFQLSPADSSLQEKIERESLTFWQDAFRRLVQNKAVVFSMIVIGLIVVLALVGPYFNEYKYDTQIEPLRTHVKLPPRVPGLEKLGIMDGTYKDGSNPYIERGIEDKYFWFGTDDLARDIWTRLWMGARISLYIGLLAVGVELVIGMTYGGVAGYYGGKVDVFMMRITEVIGGIPNMVVLILFLLVFKPGIFTMSMAMVITGWIGMARLVRAHVLKLKNLEFILASKTLGASDFQMIVKHMVPNVIPGIVIFTTFTIPGAIFYEAFLAFIGLGLPAPNASIGVLISDGYKYYKTYLYMLVIPSVVLSMLMLSLQLLANGLRDALDPKMRGH